MSRPTLPLCSFALALLLCTASLTPMGAAAQGHSISPENNSPAAKPSEDPAAKKGAASSKQTTAPAAKGEVRHPTPQPAESGSQGGVGNQERSGNAAQPGENAAALAAGLSGGEAGADSQAASTEPKEPQKIVWPFDGMKGHLDKPSAQRGFQIYSQVCAACHSLNLVTYRSLGQIGFSEGEVKALASQKQVDDENDNGERVQRPGKPFDHFVPPFPNEKASRAANNGAYPPDLSLIVKAREHGPDYVYSILTGFGNPSSTEAAVPGKYYNPYFPGHWISMPPPLQENGVTYQDGTSASVDQMARDVVIFLEWAAEPEMQQRHEMGVKALIFLGVMTVLLYLGKKRIWKKLKH